MIIHSFSVFFEENALKPKPRRQRVQHPGISSAEVAQWEGAPVTAQLSRGDGNHSNSTDIANGGIFSQSKVRAGIYIFCLKL